jgi:hypothetical protein
MRSAAEDYGTTIPRFVGTICGSGKKYKHCCLLKAVDTRAANAIDGQSSGLAKKREN